MANLEGKNIVIEFRWAEAVDRLRELVRENVDVVKDIIRNLEHNVGDLIGYIMTDGPGG